MRWLRPEDLFAFIITFSLSLVVTGVTNAQQWKQYSTPGAAGWSAAKLESAREQAVKAGSSAIFVVDHGKVVAAWGSVDHPYKAASMRKSIYDATFGAEYTKKKFDVNTTIADMGIDDLGGLTKTEKQATLEDLMTATSGIYHSAAYETRGNAELRPERGSHKPGEFWYYNNWDFNVTCAAFKKLTGKDIDRAFEQDLAGPLGLQDFKPGHVFRWLEPRSSKYPAVTFRISARDLARIGLLYLEGGKWNGRQIVSPAWIGDSTRAHTVFGEGHYRGEGNGYGRLWWILPARSGSDSVFERYRRIEALGAGGQMMVLVPELDVVIVHLADTDRGDGLPDSTVSKIMNAILSARSEAPSADAAVGAVQVLPLSGNEPDPVETGFRAIPENDQEKLAGKYMLNERIGIELYRFDGRLFAKPIGMRLPDVEMLGSPKGYLTSPIADLVVTPVKASDGPVDRLKVRFGGRDSIARRVN